MKQDISARKAREIAALKTVDDEVACLIKYYPALESCREDLAHFVGSTIGEVKLKYIPRVDCKRKIKEKVHDQKRKKLRPLITAQSEYGVDVREKIESIKQAAPITAQGNQRKTLSPLIADALKSFWVHSLGHDKFYYGSSNDHPDNATEFVDLFLRVVFRDDRKAIAVSSFRAISDPRRRKKKLKK